MNATRQAAVVQLCPRRAVATRPRLGFLGLGWTGRARMEALIDAQVADVVAVADADPELAREAAQLGDIDACASLDQLLQQRLDGVVVATPSALHAGQAMAVLERGLAVFCQKPLARTAAEAAQLVAAAHAHDRLLGVDFSYRHVAGVASLREQIRAGELGDIYAIDLTFHNACDPDKAWFYDVTQSGGGCVMDLGVHLIDLAMWVTGRTRVESVDAQLYRHGKRLLAPVALPEDYASVQYRLDNGGVADGACVRLACSWRLPARAGAVIEASFYGTRGGASLRNVGGSSCDFTVARHDGTRSCRLAPQPDDWGGRALVDWARQLALDPHFDPGARRLVDVAAIMDRIYGR
ncbi:MAG TPA: Gfo/Idh/MocA family oxidoreductase [Rhodanobacteraceae bacterium]|nr:Gfo/Idh/MocA family oxidoreductase [Rhodanobacteraceae bacterium]